MEDLTEFNLSSLQASCVYEATQKMRIRKCHKMVYLYIYHHADMFIGEGNGNSLHILAWEIPCTEKPRGLQSMGSQRAGHDLV